MDLNEVDRLANELRQTLYMPEDKYIQPWQKTADSKSINKKTADKKTHIDGLKDAESIQQSWDNWKSTNLNDETTYVGKWDDHKKEQRVTTLMGIREHGKPYKNRKINSSMTFMCAEEHGNPYNNLNSPLTYMCVEEHGKPYDLGKQYVLNSPNKKIKQGVSTRMAIREHGQPYAFSDTSK